VGGQRGKGLGLGTLPDEGRTVGAGAVDTDTEGAEDSVGVRGARALSLLSSLSTSDREALGLALRGAWATADEMRSQVGVLCHHVSQ
jgi:hypothetical protein